jgi:hypothetical protein
VETGRPSTDLKRGDALRVVANLDPGPITSAELDAVSAFLLPLVNALLPWKDVQPSCQYRLSTHLCRNCRCWKTAKGRR